MQKLKLIFPLIGIAFLGLWLFKTITSVDAGSVQSLTDTTRKYQYLALLGFACFWIYPTINWFKSGSKFNTSEVVKTVKKDVYPTHGKKIPAWAHVLRLIGLAGLVYFSSSAVRTVNDEFVFNFNYFFPTAFGAALFFLLPFVFQRKTQ